MKRLIIFISILMLVSLASGTAVSVTIYGTNKSNAQSNITCYGCNNTISVQAWNTTYVKNISVNSLNASGDAVSFNISNVTANQVQELKVNGTSINAYQAGTNGMLNFTYTVIGNRTLVLSPASRANGYNFTWGWFQNALPNMSLPLSGANKSENNAFTGTGTTLFAGILDIGGGTIDTGYSVNVKSATDETEIGIRNTAAGGRLHGIFSTGGTSSFGQGKMILYDATEGGTAGARLTIESNGVITGNGSGLSGLNASNVTGLPLKNQRNNASLERGVNTVYENTNKTARFVSVRISTNGAAGSLTFYADAANPPTTSVSLVDTGADNYANEFSVFVLPNHFYSITQTGSPAITIRSWSEWT